MEVTDLEHSDEMNEEYGRVCDRVLRLLERMEDGETVSLDELQDVSMDVSMLKTALCSPFPYDFVAKLPTVLN